MSQKKRTNEEKVDVYMNMTEFMKICQENMKMEIVQDETVSFYGIYFPKSAIKNFTDLTIENKIGEGKFGCVYQGDLDIGISR